MLPIINNSDQNRHIFFLVFFFLFCYSNFVFSQSKNEQIDKLKRDLDSSKIQQFKLVDQILELNRIVLLNQENNKKEVAKFESKIIIFQNELDSLKKAENSKSNNQSLNGIYEFSESFEGFEDGEGGFVGGGSINILNFKKSESFYFELEVYRGQFVGEIAGEAQIIGDNIARFDNEGCNLLVFIFKENYVQIIEERCEEYHGARVSFDNIYRKN